MILLKKRVVDRFLVIIKVAAMSLKLEIRLQVCPIGTNTRSGTEEIFYTNLIGSCVQN